MAIAIAGGVANSFSYISFQFILVRKSAWRKKNKNAQSFSLCISQVFWFWGRLGMAKKVTSRTATNPLDLDLAPFRMIGGIEVSEPLICSGYSLSRRQAVTKQLLCFSVRLTDLQMRPLLNKIKTKMMLQQPQQQQQQQHQWNSSNSNSNSNNMWIILS